MAPMAPPWIRHCQSFEDGHGIRGTSSSHFFRYSSLSSSSKIFFFLFLYLFLRRLAFLFLLLFLYVQLFLLLCFLLLLFLILLCSSYSPSSSSFSRGELAATPTSSLSQSLDGASMQSEKASVTAGHSLRPTYLGNYNNTFRYRNLYVHVQLYLI